MMVAVGSEAAGIRARMVQTAILSLFVGTVEHEAAAHRVDHLRPAKSQGSDSRSMPGE